jgi:exosortase H (IPTLxxWG-CTERM-specific)
LAPLISSVAAKIPVLRFVLLAVLVVLVCWIAESLPVIRQRVYPTSLGLVAKCSAWSLRRFGEDAAAHGPVVTSSRFSLAISRGCDAMDPIVLFIGAAVAFPVSWRRKLAGIGAGIGLLLALNFIRILSLYYVGVYRPASFETAHVAVWQALFVLATVMLWAFWAWWATNNHRNARYVRAQ